jgi:spoIIIJ-associated protein
MEQIIRPEERAQEFISGLIKEMKMDAESNLIEEGDSRVIRISGTDAAHLIGHRGEVLDNLQYLALLVANKGSRGFTRVIVNTEGYREKRTAALEALAGRLADKADRFGRKVELEPMNPFERRIIHSALQENDKVTTLSVGEEPNRRLVITPKNLTSDIPLVETKDHDRNRDGRNRDYDGRRDDRRNDRGRGGDGRRSYSRDDAGRGGYNRMNDKPSANSYSRDYIDGDSFGDIFESQLSSGLRPEETTHKDEAGKSFAQNFSKQGATKFKSFGYKKR